MNEGDRTVRLALAGIAVLVTAAASLSAGTTTSGLLIRVAAGGLGFYGLGAGIERAMAWASEPPPQAVTGRSAPGPVRGTRVNVLLPPASPDGRDSRDNGSPDHRGMR